MKPHQYASSILNTEPGRCYICGGGGEGNTALHHIYPGSNRRTSSENGFWVFLCPDCHRKIHANPNCGYDSYLKAVCEAVYEDRNSREEFYELIGKYYL